MVEKTKKLEEDVVYEFGLSSGYGMRYPAKLQNTKTGCLLITVNNMTLRVDMETIASLLRIKKFIEETHQFTIMGENRVPIQLEKQGIKPSSQSSST